MKSSDLLQTAYDVAVEIRDGKWNHLDSIHKKPVPACPEIIDEMRRRCPGNSVEQYQRAIADALFASR